ncbi:MAG: pyridoxamine 5'-phosphate oxidase family protein [Acidimicrobiia bacterium]
MNWETFAEAASTTSWLAYVATVRPDGEPHLAVVSPGIGREGVVWFATRASSQKARNLRGHPGVAFHWPVGGPGPGELTARGTATIHHDPVSRARLWQAGVVPFDLAGFFGSPENDDLAFVEVAIERVRLVGPDFVARVWTTGPR